MKVLHEFTNVNDKFLIDNIYNNKLDHEFYSRVEGAADPYLWICETYDLYYHEHMYSTYIKLIEMGKIIKSLSFDLDRFELYYSLLRQYESDLRVLNPQRFNIQTRVSDRFTFRPSFEAKTYMRLLMNR